MMMAWFGSRPRTAAACLAAFSVLWTGVMADELDSSLIGIISAGVVVVFLIITIIVFAAFCCYRRMESDKKSSDRNSSLARKDSGSVSTNGVAPRWAPVYSMPAEPLIYAMPTSHYYLGNYSPKFMDAESLEYMRHQYVNPRQQEVEVEVPPDVHHVTRHSELRAEHVMQEARERQEVVRERQEVTQERQEVTRERQEVVVVQGETITAAVVQQQAEEAPPSPQPNGLLVNEFAATSENYRVIRKQHKHEKMPEWLRKSYGEGEQSMDMGDESSTSGEFSGEDLVIPPMPEQVVRAEVSPHHSFLDSEDILKVPQGFTIVDYVDPEMRQTGESSYVLPAAPTDYTGETGVVTRRVIIASDSTGPLSEVSLNRDVSATTDVNTSSHVTTASDVNASGGGSSKKTTTTTKVTTTTTTLYSAEGTAVEGVSLAAMESSSSSYPASTSTPRFELPPPLPPPQIEVQGAEEADLDPVDSNGNLLHYRMRQPGNGSLSNLPEAVAASGSDWD